MTNQDVSNLHLEILLVEDNPGDVRLVQEAFQNQNFSHHLNVVSDGVEALSFLDRTGKYSNAVPINLILLDLNLPKMGGREVLSYIKTQPQLKCIPVVVFTGSNAQDDIIQSYLLHANCYITKPIDLDEFNAVIQRIREFWFFTVKLPKTSRC